MTLSQAKKTVRKVFPFAASAHNHRPGVEGWDVRVVKNSKPIVWGQRDEAAAWIAAAERIIRDRSK